TVDEFGQPVPFGARVSVGQLDVVVNAEDAPLVDEEAFDRHLHRLLRVGGPEQAGASGQQQRQQSEPAHRPLPYCLMVRCDSIFSSTSSRRRFGSGAKTVGRSRRRWANAARPSFSSSRCAASRFSNRSSSSCLTSRATRSAISWSTGTC